MSSFLDATAVICATEDSPQGRTLRDHMTRAAGDEFAVSPLVRMESLVRPLRTGDRNLLRRRLELLESCRSLRIDARTYELALHIRAAHNLSTPDAIHLATAGQHDCDRLITGDRQLLESAPGFAVSHAGPF